MKILSGEEFAFAYSRLLGELINTTNFDFSDEDDDESDSEYAYLMIQSNVNSGSRLFKSNVH